MLIAARALVYGFARMAIDGHFRAGASPRPRSTALRKASSTCSFRASRGPPATGERGIGRANGLTGEFIACS